MLPHAKPEDVGFCPRRLERALAIPCQWVESGKVPGASLLLARQGRIVAEVCCGDASPGPLSVPITPGTIFLIASIGKAITATAALALLERGNLHLYDAVASIVPEFAQEGKEDVRIIHLLTHTSGLPDTLPNDVELRQAHQPLSEFVRRICQVELDFPPGTQIQYQSCGFAMLGEVVERLDGRPLRRFLQEELFAPLGMSDSSLGASPEIYPRIASCNLPQDRRATDYNWNTEYWRSFGAPWGGMFSTARDLASFLQLFLNGGRLGDRQILSPATVRLMTSNITHSLVPASVGGTAWGLGWRIKAAVTESCFGDLASWSAFGHGGATGTFAFADPALQVVCVILTNQPGACRPETMGTLNNAILASVVE